MWSSSTSLCINPEICRELLAFKGFLGRPLVSTLLDLVSTHCPKLAQMVFWVVMRNQGSPMGPGKSDEHPLYEELTV
ncbi:hypothetical protein Taro_046450 [Colocasia esculenta]|uniref:Uncharacterized protein n=1 Tax=Colocasia esculenta TaxID=4460 RepID=A0A843X659_COLES|nr:hypothetical protein [Colocasia esculenta]